MQQYLYFSTYTPFWLWLSPIFSWMWTSINQSIIQSSSFPYAGSCQHTGTCLWLSYATLDGVEIASKDMWITDCELVYIVCDLKLSVYLLRGLPLGRLPSTSPSYTILTNLSLSISFRFSNHLFCLLCTTFKIHSCPSLSLTSSLRTRSIHVIPATHLRYFISTACTQGAVISV